MPITRASRANHANRTLLIKFAFGSVVSEFLFLICVQKASSMKILLFCVINSSRHRNCFVRGFIHSLFVSKALTRSYLARSGFWHKHLVNKTPYAALSMTLTIYVACDSNVTSRGGSEKGVGSGKSGFSYCNYTFWLASAWVLYDIPNRPVTDQWEYRRRKWNDIFRLNLANQYIGMTLTTLWSFSEFTNWVYLIVEHRESRVT